MKKYGCPRCDITLDYETSLSPRWNKVRAWLWLQAHKLNCGKDAVFSGHTLSDRHGVLVCSCGDFVGDPTKGDQKNQALKHFIASTTQFVHDRDSLVRRLKLYLTGGTWHPELKEE